MTNEAKANLRTVPHVLPSVRGTKRWGEARSNAFRQMRKILFPRESNLNEGKSIRNTSFSAHVRWSEHGAPVQNLKRR